MTIPDSPCNSRSEDMTTSTQPHDAAQRPAQRWDPLRELAELHERLGGMIEPGGTPATWTPPVDIIEDDEAWVVEAELPGVDRKDISIELRDNELEISGEIKERERKGILRRRTRRVGAFDFRVTLPGHVEADAVAASMDDGVLTVRIPKPQHARPHRIEVK
jgi:HSP20 family protein